MTIQSREFNLGAALIRIIEYDGFKALNRASRKYGHYKINNDRILMIKYGSLREDGTYRFTFGEDDRQVIGKDLKANWKVYLALVCGDEEICLLADTELQEIIQIDGQGSQFVAVMIEKGKSLVVWGSLGDLKNKISRNAMPNKIFEE